MQFPSAIIATEPVLPGLVRDFERKNLLFSTTRHVGKHFDERAAHGGCRRELGTAENRPLHTKAEVLVRPIRKLRDVALIVGCRRIDAAIAPAVAAPHVRTTDGPWSIARCADRSEHADVVKAPTPECR